MARQCPKPKRKRDATWFRDKVLLVEAQGSGKVLNEEELAFLADPGVAEGPVTHTVITHNAAYQADDLDAYDSDCDDISIAKAVFMANLSSYRSDVLSKDTKNGKLLEERQNVDLSTREELIMDDIIREKNAQFADFEKENNYLKQNLSEQLKEKELLTKTFNVLKNECKEKEAKNNDKEIALEKKVKELDNIVCKMGQSAQTMHMLTKLKVFYDNNLKQALGFQNPFYLKKAQQIRPMLYDGTVIAKETNVILIADSEETLMLEEESRSKMLLKKDFGKHFVPRRELSNEQALHPNTDQSAYLPVKIEAPRELPKKSVAITNLNAQLHEKVFLITTIKNDLRKFKGKDIVDNSAQVSNTTTIAPGMYKLDPVILAPKVKNNREAHEYYLKHTMEQAAILRELLQELLGYVRDTCPDIHKPSEKLVATSIVFYRSKPSTSASGSKPSGNTKNDKIPRAPSSNEKNKVEVQSRKVKSSLNKRNFDSKNVCIEHVKHPVKGANALCYVCNECLFDANHAMCLIDHVNSMNVRAKSVSKKNKKRKEWKPTSKVFNCVGYKWKPTGRTFTLVGNACTLARLTTTNKVPLRVPIPLKVVAPKHVVTRLYTRRPKVPKTVQNSKPKVAKSMTANRMEPGTSRGSDTLVAPSSSSLIDCRDMMASSLICLLSKATKTKSWLWHRRLSHLNFGAINHLARHGLVRGLPRLKFEKDHLFSTCAMGKSKKQSHKPKSEDTNQEKLYLLHMDLCGPMRVASVNGKKYILAIVDDYSRFTWVKFLASKDEAPDFIIKFLKMIQVRLNATVRNIRTDNGTEFVNQTLRDYYEQVGISHETSVARTPQQNGVVERKNHTLVKAAQTMLIYAKASLFLWAEAVATAYYTQN
ncbi:retrovirus-related pol polyprotein from transposon TNT 1-94 [Tanacetum coccineum]|uniref:Retrovirus-related pol polyprotein from transposon TNT 1-94 n=1 Tax=Tanacetum coccineum TaxID=301880 RepID=A0ABQ5EE95_9ASTR